MKYFRTILLTVMAVIILSGCGMSEVQAEELEELQGIWLYGDDSGTMTIEDETVISRQKHERKKTGTLIVQEDGTFMIQWEKGKEHGFRDGDVLYIEDFPFYRK